MINCSEQMLNKECEEVQQEYSRCQRFGPLPKKGVLSCLSWNESETLEWVKTNAANNLSQESQNEFIERKITLFRLSKETDYFLENVLLVKSELSRKEILEKTENILNESIKEELSLMDSIPYRNWNNQQLIIWFLNLLKNNLSQQTYNNLIMQQLSGKNIESLDNDILQNKLAIEDQSSRILIAKSIKKLQEEGFSKKQQESSILPNNPNERIFLRSIDNIAQENPTNQSNHQSVEILRTKEAEEIKTEINITFIGTQQQYNTNQQPVIEGIQPNTYFETLNNNFAALQEDHVINKLVMKKEQIKCAEDEHLFIFFCYFTQFKQTDNLKLTFFTNQGRIFNTYEQVTSIQMTHVPHSKIFYLQLKMKEQDNLYYNYSVQRQGFSQKETNSKIQSRTWESLQKVDYTIFDIPNRFGSLKDKSTLTIKQYIIYYVQNITIIGQNFFKWIIKVIGTEQKDEVDLFDLTKSDLAEIPILHQIIYSGILSQQNFNKKEELQTPKLITITSIRQDDDVNKFLSLPKQLQDYYLLGLMNCIKHQSKMVEALSLSTELKKRLPDEFWQFEFKKEPKQEVLKIIDFDGINQVVRDRFYDQIVQCEHLQFSSILQFLKLVKPSTDRIINSLLFAFDNVSFKNSDFVEYYLSLQNQQLKVDLLFDKKIREKILPKKEVIVEVIKLYLEQNLIQQYGGQLSNIYQILIDLIDILQKYHLRDVFKNLIKLLDKYLDVFSLNKSTNTDSELLIQLLTSLRNLILHNKECYQLILSIDVSLKNPTFIDLIISWTETIIRNMKLPLKEATEQLELLSKSSFLNLNIGYKSGAIQTVFNMINIQQEFFNFTKFQLIDNEYFLKMLTVLYNNQLLKECELSKELIIYANEILRDLNNQEIKLSDLRQLFDIKFEHIDRFTRLCDIQLERAVFDLTKIQLNNQLQEIEELSTFADIMIDLKANGYIELNQFLEELFKDKQITLKKFQNHMESIPKYKCTEILFQVYQIPFTKRYIQKFLNQIIEEQFEFTDKNNPFNLYFKNLKQQSKFNGQWLSENILFQIDLISQHLQALKLYDDENDQLKFYEIQDFWQFTSDEVKEYDEYEFLFQINKAYKLLLPEFELVEFDTSKNGKLIQHLVYFQMYFRDKDKILQLYDISSILKFEQIDSFREEYNNLKQLTQFINKFGGFENRINQIDYSFSTFIHQIEESVKLIISALPKQIKEQLISNLSQLEVKKPLIQYLNRLDEQKINLEDLVDIIDDTSMETDVLVQEMMSARNGLQQIRYCEEDQPNIAFCIFKRFQNFEKNIELNEKLKGIIKRCVENLDTIVLKIDNQSDRSASTLLVMKNIQQNIQLKIERANRTSESVVTFCTQIRSEKDTHIQILTQEELNMHCNRFKLIKNNNSKDTSQTEHINSDITAAGEDNCKDIDISTKIEELLELSEEMKLVLDNLMNLGHQQFSDNFYTVPSDLDHTILALKNTLNTYKLIDEENVKQLEEARQKYISLNFFPPYTFQLIEKLINKKFWNYFCVSKQNEDLIGFSSSVFNEEEPKQVLDELCKLAKYVNEHEQPNIQAMKEYLQEQCNMNSGKMKRLDIYGRALDILLPLPRVEVIGTSVLKLKKYSKGQAVAYRRIESQDLLLKSIMISFLAHGQKPSSWQILFCTSKTQLHQLVQFAQLAKNASVHEKYHKHDPLFLICQFQNVSLNTQRLFVDKLEDMYKLSSPFNLLITFVGKSDNINSIHIIQEFKYASEVNYHDKHLSDAAIFQELQMDCFNNITLHKSKYSGLGKTYQIKKRSHFQNQKLIEIPLYGETTTQELIDLFVKKTKQLNDNNENSYRIHLNIYNSKSDDIHVFLFQLLILRRLSQSVQQFVQIPSNILIEIELQNTFLDTLAQKIKYFENYLLPTNIIIYRITEIQFKDKTITGADIDCFDTEENPNFEQEDLQIAFQYLKNLDKIENFKVIDVKKDPVTQQEAIKLIKSYFLNRVENNFSYFHVISILKFFIKQAVLFHRSPYLQIEEFDNDAKFNNKRIRRDVFQSVINTCVAKSCQIKSNYQEELEENSQKDYYQLLEERSKNIIGWDEGKDNDFCLTVTQEGSFVPIFKNINSVPDYYKNYCKDVGTTVKDWDELNSQQIRKTILMNLCTTAINFDKVKKDLEQNYSHIALTKTIARKICFLFIKICSDIPTLILGETGVGKTILVKYLSSLIGGAIFVFNVHAGISQKEIIEWVENLINLQQQDKQQLLENQLILVEQISKEPDNQKLQQDLQNIKIFMNIQDQISHTENICKERKIILFFDEINTNQNVDGILKELLIDQRMLGEPLPKNFVAIAAANPYKFKQKNNEEENNDESLKIAGFENQETSKLIYHVYPFPDSMYTFIWNFGELLPEDEKKIVKQMITNQTNICNQMKGFKQALLTTISKCQQFSRIKLSVRSVSLRDVSRFLQVYQHFLTHPAWKKGYQEALLLSVFYSYYCRFNSLTTREELCEFLELGETVKETVDQEMEKIKDIINFGEANKSIAYTTTLKENLFMTLISVLNQIPIIMVGPPGSSKTLCTRLLYNSMKGRESKIEFFKNLPLLMCKTYQCSILSTSESIQKAFNSAKQLVLNVKKTQNNELTHQKYTVIIIADEIGLAEQSKNNPLKVLHPILEDKSNVPMIGLSNWSLDASKMNRVVIANRPKLSEIELVEAATAIQQRISPDIDSNIILNLAKDSFSYFQSKTQKTFFHGTRDFYNCIQYVCSQLHMNKENLSEELIEQILLIGVLRNFGGTQNNKKILGLFKLSITEKIMNVYENNLDKYNPTELIQMNVQEKNCRNLMIISNKPDQVLQYTERLCKERPYKIFQGSDLFDDFAEYNSLKMLNEIITCMEEGYLVIMYSLESLYQSFYDLFNQNYVELGEQKFCRIAIGSDSIRSRVNQDFKVIIIAQSQDVYGSSQHYDPPLLNRFEKQYLDLKDVLNENERIIQQKIFQFIDQCSLVKSDDLKVPTTYEKWEFNVQDMFPIMQEKNKEDMIFSLTLKHKNIKHQSQRIENSILELLNLSTISGAMRANFLKKLDQRYMNHFLNLKYRFGFNELLQHLQNIFDRKKNNNLLSVKNEETQYYENDNDLFEYSPTQHQTDEQNVIVYTPELKHSYPKSSVKSYLEVELRWMNANLLKQQIKIFFSTKELVNLILITNNDDSLTRILHAKRILEEERLIFEKKLKSQQQHLQKNYIIVIQTVNLSTDFTGLSFDKQWRQIYIENTQGGSTSPCYDISNYLKPIQEVLQNEENGIYEMVLQQCLPKVLSQLNFEGKIEDLKDRLRVYKEFLSNKWISEKLHNFIKNKIKEKIQSECATYQEIITPCEWYQFVSIRMRQNQINNKFISSLKQYLVEQSLTVFIKIIYLAEKNNIISTMMSGQINNILNKEIMIAMLNLTLSNFTELNGNERNCGSSNISFPFFTLIKESQEMFKQDILSNFQQIEDNQQLNKQQNNNQNAIELNILEIDQLLASFTQFNNDDVKIISNIAPLQYFNNLHNDLEYQYTQNNTLKKIVKQIINTLYQKETVELYHSLLWMNEKIFIQLSQVWQLAEDYSEQESYKIYQTFENNLINLLQSLKNECETEDNKKLSQLHRIWREILIFTIKICEVFILPRGEFKSEGEKDNWFHDLKKSLQIIFTYYSESGLDFQEIFSYMSPYHFILRIQECFSKDNQKVRLIINDFITYSKGEVVFISAENFNEIKGKLIEHCDGDKQDELTLQLIWQLLKSDDFKQPFSKLNSCLKSIIQSIHLILQKLDYSNLKDNEQSTHYYIFSKRILSQIIYKMYEDFDENIDESIEDLLQPNSNQSFCDMQIIFNNLKINLEDPISSIVIDIIGEQKYYNNKRILNFIAQEHTNQDCIEINENKINEIQSFIVNKENSSEKDVLLNIIELKILQEICLTICEFVYENYLYHKRADFSDEHQQIVEANYESDRIRKNRMILLLNSSLEKILQCDPKEINPLAPMIVVKIFNKEFNIHDLTVLSNILNVFNNKIFIDDSNTYKKLSVSDLVNNSKQPDFRFNLINVLSELVLSQNIQDFNEIISKLDSQQPKVIDKEILSEMYAMYAEMIGEIKDQSLHLIKIFTLSLIASSFLEKDTFVKQLYSEEISIDDIYVPFMSDSDEIIIVKNYLQHYEAIRRFECQNCHKNGTKKKGIWYFNPPCCLPPDDFKQQCDVCGFIPKMIGSKHQSDGMMPPKYKDKQEPVFIRENFKYDEWGSYYNQPDYPYKREVQTINEFIKNRGRVDKGYQHLFFNMNNSNRMRNLTNIEDIMLGRIFMLSILCFYCYRISKKQGKEQAKILLNFKNPVKIFQSKKQADCEYSIVSAWEILKSKFHNDEKTIVQHYSNQIIKTLLERQSSEKNNEFKINLSKDESRIQFETTFSKSVLQIQKLQSLQKHSEKPKDPTQNTKFVILNGRLDLIEDGNNKYNTLKYFRNLCRIQSNSITSSRKGFENFHNYTNTKQDSTESKFFKKIINSQKETYIYSQIYFIQNWIKMFNQIYFDKITQKQAAQITISEYVQTHQLESVFETFKVAWNFFKSQIDLDSIKIYVDCYTTINLDDIDHKNQNIEIFCYSDDTASRGYPLYLLLQHFKVEHNRYLESLNQEFSSLLNTFSQKKMVLMNERNFISPKISFAHSTNQEDFFENYVEKFQAKNPLVAYEEENIYDLKDLTNEFIEDHFQGLTIIQEPESTDLERNKLTNFEFKGNHKATNILVDFPDKIQQTLYPDIQNNKLQPFLFIDLMNIETSMKLLEVLTVAMSIVLKAISKHNFTGDSKLVDVLSGFKIQEEGINFAKENIKLCHMQHVYELAERRCIEILMQDIHPLFQVELNQNQKDELNRFCKQETHFDLEVFFEALGRITVRRLCKQNIQMNTRENLFNFLNSVDGCWGVENQFEFSKLKEHQWNEKYSIFNENLDNSIILGQIYKLYEEIKIFLDKRQVEENLKKNVTINKQLIDQKKIEQEHIMNSQYINSNQQEKKMKQKQQILGYK